MSKVQDAVNVIDTALQEAAEQLIKDMDAGIHKHTLHYCGPGSMKQYAYYVIPWNSTSLITLMPLVATFGGYTTYHLFSDIFQSYAGCQIQGLPGEASKIGYEFSLDYGDTWAESKKRRQQLNQ